MLRPFLLLGSVSPCVEPTDAKLLPVLRTKPNEMSRDDWNFLCNEYDFGTIIFGLPRSQDNVPIPVREFNEFYSIFRHRDLLSTSIFYLNM
jgi:hypothetical protein